MQGHAARPELDVKAEVCSSFITRSLHKGTTSRVWTGDQLYPVLCHCQLGQDIPYFLTLWLKSIRTWANQTVNFLMLQLFKLNRPCLYQQSNGNHSFLQYYLIVFILHFHASALVMPFHTLIFLQIHPFCPWSLLPLDSSNVHLNL